MQILNGIRIVSFNHYLMGPLGIQLLADLGADVVAVEPVGGAWHRHWGGADRKVDGQSVLFLAANRNKRSLAVNLKSPKGLDIARRLLRTADVLAENFRPGVMAGMGLSYEELRPGNPRLIYASASGYGPDGPYAKRPGQDLLLQAITGLATITGNTQDKARAVGVSVIDHHGASLLALGILAALFSRSRTGEGMRIDVDLLSAGLDLQAESLVCFFNGRRDVSINPHPRVAGWHYTAPYGIYATRDGHLAISFALLSKLADVLEVPALASIPQDEARERSEEIATLIAEAVQTRDTSDWLERFSAAELWHAPVNDYSAVLADPQVQHNGSIVTVAGATDTPITLVRHPVRYNGEIPEVRFPPQTLGAQTTEIMEELGYDRGEISSLLSEGVIAAASEEAGRASIEREKQNTTRPQADGA
jgi:crotonobetainyl-CoA:carnitine CoA-transferase CaiB-like acyl-CoA transferase